MVWPAVGGGYLGVHSHLLRKSHTASTTISLVTTNHILLRPLPKSSPHKWCLSPLCQPDLSYTPPPICHVLNPNPRVRQVGDVTAGNSLKSSPSLCYRTRYSERVQQAAQSHVAEQYPVQRQALVLLFLVPFHHSCSLHTSNFLPGASSALDDISRPLQSYSHRWSSQNSSCIGHMCVSVMATPQGSLSHKSCWQPSHHLLWQ